MAKKLSELGANVIAVSRSESNLFSLKEECPNIQIIAIDLNNWRDTQEKLVRNCNLSVIDMLVNNAAISDSQLVGQITQESIDEMFSVNYKASLNLIQLVSEGMKKRRSGSIVNVSSVSGMAAMNGHCVYGSTKSAMDMLTKISAKELGPFNVRVNSVNPTVVWTELAKTFWSDEKLKTEMKSKIPMGRFVQVEEVVDPIIFLMSDYASMINGILLPIDGGFTAC